MSDPDKEKPPRPHTLADHRFGTDMDHVHDGEADHDHDHEHDDAGPEGSPQSSPLWQQDNVMLTSVGMDIGSAGTQVIFSRFALRRLGEELSSRYYVVGRETLYQSPVALTPYRKIGRASVGKE